MKKIQITSGGIFLTHTVVNKQYLPFNLCWLHLTVRH